jgi:hypothetical protein
MHKQIKKLAEAAGFSMWEKESWNSGDTIDWSCRYDDELVNYTRLVVEECCESLGEDVDTSQLLKRFGFEHRSSSN